MTRKIAAVDLFCGAGGLTYGLQRAGIQVVAGIDLDPACEYPFVANNDSQFIKADIRTITPYKLAKLYPAGAIRVLAGCAPCQPFSSLQRDGKQTRKMEWGLLGEFARLVKGLNPQLVTMENVPRLASQGVFKDFVAQLEKMGYEVDYKSVYCPQLGLPQQRRRLVLLASRIGPIKVPTGRHSSNRYKTVRQAIGNLSPIVAGAQDAKDPLHKARTMNADNIERLKHSKPGGTWRDWPEALRVKCHTKKKGRTFGSVYGRMRWDSPSPTITTQSYNYGTGRFGHPVQDRAISLREAAILQTFPKGYKFTKPRAPVHFSTVGRLIGNAVPPKLGEIVGRELRRAAHGPRARARRS